MEREILPIAGLLIGVWGMGALVNYLADVLPSRRSLSRPLCRRCGQEQAWPKYLFLPGNCPACGYAYGWRNGLVLFLLFSGYGWLYFKGLPPLRFAEAIFWIAYFLLIIVIDVEYRLILHPISAVGAVFALANGWWRHGFFSTLVGGLTGFALMMLIYGMGLLYGRWATRKRRVAIEDEEALGFGDVALSTVIGLLLGWPGILAGLVLAILLAGGVGLLYLGVMFALRRYRPGLTIPYGPFLSIAAMWLLFFR